MTEQITTSPDYGRLAQQAAEDHLDALNAALDAEELGPEAEWPESAGPYCGCQTCVIREVLWSAWPWIEAHVEANPR